MRKILSSVLMLAAGMVLLSSCEKLDVPQDVNTLGKGSYLTLTKANNLILDFSNLAGSKASIDAAQFGADQEKLTIYVAPGSPTQDRTQWKKIKEVLNDNNGNYALSVSGTEIQTAIAPAAMTLPACIANERRAGFSPPLPGGGGLKPALRFQTCQ